MYSGNYDKGTQVRVQIRSTRGETIDLTVPTACSVGQLRKFLIQEYDYPPETCLVYGSSVVSDDSLVEAFPYGSLVISTSGDAMRTTHRVQGQQSSDSSGAQQSQSQSHSHYRTASQSSRCSSRAQSHQQHQYYDHRQHQQETAHSHLQEGGEKSFSRQPSSNWQTNQQQYSLRTNSRRAFSPSTASSNMTQRGDEARGRLARGDEQARSTVHQSTPPRRSPRQTMLSETEINASSLSSQIPTAVSSVLENEATKEGGATPGPASAAATPMRASRTRREGNCNEPKKTAQDEVADAHKKQCVSLQCVSPALKKNITLELTDDATLGDVLLAIVAEEPRLVGCKVIFRGKLLNGSDAKLSSYGIRAGGVSSSLIPMNSNEKNMYTLFIASGGPNGTQKAMLMEIETDVACIESVLEQRELTIKERRGYYEELMRILFRADNMQDLEDELRARRKELVKKVTFMQDKLKVVEDS